MVFLELTDNKVIQVHIRNLANLSLCSKNLNRLTFEYTQKPLGTAKILTCIDHKHSVQLPRPTPSFHYHPANSC